MNGLLQPCTDEDCRHTPAPTTAADGRQTTDDERRPPDESPCDQLRLPVVTNRRPSTVPTTDHRHISLSFPLATPDHSGSPIAPSGTGFPGRFGPGSERTLSPASRNRQFRGGDRGGNHTLGQVRRARCVSRHWRRRDLRRTGHGRSGRKKSRDQVAAPSRRQRDGVVLGRIGDGTTAGSEAGRENHGNARATPRHDSTPVQPARRNVGEPGSASYSAPSAAHSTASPVSHAADAPSAAVVADLTAFH